MLMEMKLMTQCIPGSWSASAMRNRRTLLSRRLMNLKAEEQLAGSSMNIRYARPIFLIPSRGGYLVWPCQWSSLQPTSFSEWSWSLWLSGSERTLIPSSSNQSLMAFLSSSSWTLVSCCSLFRPTWKSTVLMLQRYSTGHSPISCLSGMSESGIRSCRLW